MASKAEKRIARPSHNNMSLGASTSLYGRIQKAWKFAEMHALPEIVDKLTKRLGRVMWEDGYMPVPHTPHLETEEESYGTSRGVGVFTDVEACQTERQRYWPLAHALDETLNERDQLRREMEAVKCQRWYCLGRLFGFVRA